MKTFIESKPYRTITEKDAQSGYNLVKLKSQRSPPKQLSTLIGDILFNLRSSLDHVVYALAVLNGATDEQKEASEFPVFSDRSKFTDAAPRKIGSLIPEAQAVIERAQPYHAADPDRHPVRLLHELNRIDKHRLLHVVQTVSSRSDVVLEVGGQMARYVVADAPIGGFQNGAVIARYRLTGPETKAKAKVNMEPELSCQVCFGPGTNAVGMPVGTTLRGIRDHIWIKVFSKIERFMPRF